MSNQQYVSTFLDTYLALRASSEAERKQRVKEREALLSTIAVVEAELAKPEYFGYIIERDRIGYLEALSKTKMTFRGLNPHDPLNGMVVNGGINPDFVMMLEENFFRVNSKNLSIDELKFVRYEAERDKMIDWLKEEFQELLIDDEYLKQEIGVTQEELFQGLSTNSLLFATKIDSEEIYIVDKNSYLKGVMNGEFYETIPQKFCVDNSKELFQANFDFLKKKESEIIQNKQIIEEKANELDAKTLFLIITIFFVLGAMFVVKEYY